MKQAMANWKKIILLPLIALVLLVIACDDQIMNDLQTVADQSTVVTNYPAEVQKRIDEIKAKNPKAEVQVVGVMKYDQNAIDNLNKSIDANEIRSVHIVKLTEKKDSDFDNYVVIEKGGTLDMVASTTAENGEVFTVVEKTAQPVGGMPALYDLVGKNIQYPVEARRKNVEGKVFVQFIINEDGSLSDFTVLKGIGEGCDEEAVRVLKLSPNWTPGKQRGVAVKQRMVLPITFGLSNNAKIGKINSTLEIQYSDKKFETVIAITVENNKKFIAGIVKDEQGNPLKGANVVLQNTTQGTITKEDGSFEIWPQNETGSLVVSYIGYNVEYITF
jgi:TonB family protein